jgi:hypothetical protein
MNTEGYVQKDTTRIIYWKIGIDSLEEIEFFANEKDFCFKFTYIIVDYFDMFQIKFEK